MAALDDLLARIQDPALRADIEREIAPLRGDRELGLVFERHLPEKVRLPELEVRRGATVEVRDDMDSPAWQVRKVVKGIAHLARNDGAGHVLIEERPLDELVVVREFGQPIYPGLLSVGRVERGGDKPFHSVINAENYHALETLLYTCEGQVDCIYIDPPYNTGARDWKYNNDYVDGQDTYRHSKWLSFMEKRLRLAGRLLHPDTGVLIVTIDEKEYLRLGLLLEQMFPAARIQMVSSVINPKGATRSNAFARTDEYIFFVMMEEASPQALELGNEWKVARDTRSEKLRWAELLRAGTNARREDRPNLFYPVFLRQLDVGPAFAGVGEVLLEGERDSIAVPDGCVAVWPIRSDGSEGNWQVSPVAMQALIEKGYARIGGWRGAATAISYLKRGEQQKVESGVFPVLGHRPDGSVLVDASDYAPVFVPGTQWRIASHEAGGPGGTGLLRSLLPGRRFPFPKSVYAVEDALRFFVAGRPDALVVDAFAGSGTTAHAVMRLNAEDQGRRRSIVITNNEVGPEAEQELALRGHQQGSRAWEALGIFEFITRPRIEAAVTGLTHSGEPASGSYSSGPKSPCAQGLPENVEFFKLTYEDPDRVQLGHAFAAVAPLLWLMAGATGPRIDAIASGWALPEAGRYGVLFDPDAWPGFCAAVKDSEYATHAFVVTDSDAVFTQVAAELPDTVTPVRLYESYLTSFTINTGVRS